MISEDWTPLRHHVEQSRMWRSSARFVVAACGRGSGKTELAKRRVVRYLAVKKPWHDPKYFYALPTIAQARRVAWDDLIAMTPKEWLDGDPNISSMTIKTVFGSALHVVGMDKPQRIEGVQWDGGVVDESCDQKPGVFGRTILPALAHRHGWCWRIGVPKRYGCGAQEFKSEFKKGETCEDGTIEAYNWPSSDIIDAAEVEWARQNLDPRDYNEQYNAQWEKVGGLIHYAFDPVLNVQDVAYNPGLPVAVGSDFNVDPMSWVVGHVMPDAVHIFDEIRIRNTNTRQTLDKLAAKYGEHNAGFQFHGDASGSARKTSANESDYLQIKGDKRFAGARVFYPSANPRIADRFAACNALFKNASGERRCIIHPRCKHLITDLDTRAYKEGSSVPDDYGDVGHMTDALGYIIHRRFPISFKREGKTHVHAG